MISRDRPSACIGLHLSGSNTPKSSVVVLRGGASGSSPSLAQVYEKIGPVGTSFSDERVIEILKHEAPVTEAFVDCPIASPPCVHCTRPSCPGVMECEDTEVAYMLALHNQHPRGRKGRLPNPQVHRLWDIYAAHKLGMTGEEPTYSANRAPLVVRTATLQRRLAQAIPSLKLKETSVNKALLVLSEMLGFSRDQVENFKHFEKGVGMRKRLVNALLIHFGVAANDDHKEMVQESLENFQAFVAAMMALAHDRGETKGPTKDFSLVSEGWVYLPLPKR